MEDEEDEMAEEMEMAEARNEERRREEEERRVETRVERAGEIRRLFWELRELERELGVMREEREEAEKRSGGGKNREERK